MTADKKALLDAASVFLPDSRCWTNFSRITSTASVVHHSTHEASYPSRRATP
jgi:hypothetical protein